MSKYNETIKDILTDFLSFLNALHREKLSSANESHRQVLLAKINSLHCEYPSLQNAGLLAEATSPAPYLDMKGNRKSTEYVFSDPVSETHYEPYGSETYSGSKKSGAESDDLGYDGDKYDATPIAASELANAFKCGYLEKKVNKLGIFNQYQKRWCAIRDGRLYYYQRPTDKRQCGQVPLADYEVQQILASPSGRDSARRELCFELICPGKRTHQFMASTPKDLQEWISAIENYARTQTHAECLQIPAAQESKFQNEILDEDIYEIVEDPQHIFDATNPIHAQILRQQDGGLNEMANTQFAEPEQELYDDADFYTRKSEVPVPASSLADMGFNSEILKPEEWYVGLWNCKADDVNELDFKRGDLIRIINKNYDAQSWWVGELCGRVGLIPRDYLMEAYEEVIKERTS